ncbi:kinesin-like protein KIF21A isoform X4 [Mya arenaria]|uniref:kinesin-like protein KIF21A isoform X4 n=1 Tax=Mya arenaria TaxID=6604 RepID=UPI0022E49B92|nr:kinesin-like protein KIF21A isoform X4 [Mya arenaria]
MGDQDDTTEDDTSVRVALRIRPQLARERIDMCQVCTAVMEHEKQVILGKDKSFTFDHVYDIPSTQEFIYQDCVLKLIDGCFDGYNATVVAYGQTGSGKTYTMGTGFDVSMPEEEIGIIPRAVEHLFRGIEERRQTAIQKNEPPPDFKVNAQFMELYNEEILDLLDATRDVEHKNRKSNAKIHEDAEGGIYVVGITTRMVHTPKEAMQCLEVGALSRSTASTNMNATSSRSHAVFTLHIKQHRLVKEESPVFDGEEGEHGGQGEGTVARSDEALTEFEILTAKFHFVDLAGSERLKRTGATGDRAKEGISINCGLLALGNVISALGDKTKKGSHVPYRDSKLTRLLQDSLGGNSRTLMIACVSPSDRDFMETLNTLKYANRARNIKNKVIANQDKASKQLAILRQEIMQLQQELTEFKSGKRVVDTDGLETTSDVFHENSMLQSQNDKLRTRIKSLNDTVEQLTVRNSELLADRALADLGNASGDPGSDEVVSLIRGYERQLEELRAKLSESEHMNERLRRTHQLSASRLGMSTLLSPMANSMSTMSMSQSYEAPLSPENQLTSILGLAKKDVKKLKKLSKSRARSRVDHDSDKENVGSDQEQAEDEGVVEEGGEEIVEKASSEKSEKDDSNIDENGNLEQTASVDGDIGDEEDDDDDELDLGSSGSDSESDKDSDNIHEDLAELTCEISIKQRLIEELEQSQRRIHAMKSQYEEKVTVLMNKIRETEKERDKVLSNIGPSTTGKVDANKAAENSKKVKEQFERKLNEMQNELKKVNAAKKEHAKLIKNNSHTEKQLKTLQHELGEMKKTKVRLMKQMKEDTERNKKLDARRTRELSQLKREQMKKEGLIRTLENQKKNQDMILKRKQEEVESLRKKNRPMSSQAAGRLSSYPRQPRIAQGPISTSSPIRRRHRGVFNARAAKNKWNAIEKNVNSVINKKQTITNIEKDMDIWLKHREKLGKKIEKYQKKKETLISLGHLESKIVEVSDVIASLQNQVAFAQENITECQSNIVQVEESKEEGGGLDPATLVSAVSLEEAKYLLEHFITMAISKGQALAGKESEVRELMAKLHQTELNNTLQQDLLKHMMDGRADIEVDNLMTEQVDDMDSSTSSSSSSPVDSMFESRVEPMVSQRSSPLMAASWDPATAAKRDKTILVQYVRNSLPVYLPARRKQANLDDMLYAASDEMVGTLNPVPENAVTKTKVQTGPPVMSQSAPPPAVPGGGDNFLMPPPTVPPPHRTLPQRPASTSRLPSVSPSMRRKDNSKPSPSPSPVLRRKNSFTLPARSNSVDAATSSDTTPPSSPQPGRRADRLTNADANVFSRLTSNTTGISDLNVKSGSIVTASARLSMKQSGPLTCSQVVEGHLKAVLSVTATDDLLFTSSKDRTARGWDLQTGKQIHLLPGHPNNVNVVKYSPEHHLAFTVSQSYISVWDTRQKSCIKTLNSSGLTQDGQVSTSSVQIDLPMGEHHINDIALNANNSLLYSAAGNTVRVWDLKRFAAVGKLSGGHQAAIMVLGVDQQTDKDVVITGSKDHYIKVFEVQPEGEGVFTPKYNLEPPHYDGIQSLAVQGNTLFSGSRDFCIKKWDLSNHSLGQSLNSAHKDWICALDFHPGSGALLSGCRAGYLKMWNPETCTQIAEIRAHTSPINAIATNSTAIFTASNDNTVRIWRHRNAGSQDFLSDNADTPALITDKNTVTLIS